MSTRKPKCKSRTFPCPSGDRCPEHRGQVAAVLKALKESDLETASLLTKQKLEAEDRKKLETFLEKVKVKTKRDGSLEVVAPGDPETIYEKSDGVRTMKITKTSKEKLHIPPIDPAEAVDKTVAIRSGNDYKNGFQNNLNDLYDGNVTIEESNAFDGFIIKKLGVAEGYRGKGVESHVLASFVVDHRPDLYDFYSDDLDIPYSEYKKAGFEPNPYYWAGQTHPESGVTYPTEAELDRAWDDDEDSSDVDENYFAYQLYALRNLGHPENKVHPYMRMKHGWTFTNIPLNQPYSKEKAQEFSKLKAEKEDRLLKSRNPFYPLDIS